MTMRLTPALVLVAACGWGTMSPREFDSEFGPYPRDGGGAESHVPTAAAPARGLRTAALAGAALPTELAALDDPRISALAVFDPLAIDGPRHVAATWRADAVLVHLEVANPTPEGLVDLAHVANRTSVSYGFRSASCARSGRGPCVLVLSIIAENGRATAATIDGEDPPWTGEIRDVPCPLRDAIRALAARFPSERADGATLELVTGKPRWTLHTFDGSHGATHAVSGTDCRPAP